MKLSSNTETVTSRTRCLQVLGTFFFPRKYVGLFSAKQKVSRKECVNALFFGKELYIFPQKRRIYSAEQSPTYFRKRDLYIRQKSPTYADSSCMSRCLLLPPRVLCSHVFPFIISATNLGDEDSEMLHISAKETYIFGKRAQHMLKAHA